jgi:intein/homing endonuclease
MAISNIHTDSISGDIDAKLRKRPGHVTAVKGRQIEQEFINQEIGRRQHDLPAQQESNANINFLGSSYSGADIKVIAHMYDVQGWTDSKLKELNYKHGVTQTVLDGCTSLLGGGLTNIFINTDGQTIDYNTQRQIFLKSAGLGTSISAESGGGGLGGQGANETDVQQEAGAILLSNIFKAGSFSFIGIAQMRSRALYLKHIHEQLLSEYEQHIQHINDLGDRNTSDTITLGTLQTISIQSFREKNAVRALGHAYVKGYTRGPRCLPATERVLIKDRGYINIDQVQYGDYIQSLPSKYNKVLGVYKQGTKKCHQLTLRNGYTIKASWDHPISTPNGWVNMEDLEKNDLVNVAAVSPCPKDEYNIPDSILKMIAYLLGDGTTQIYSKKNNKAKEHRISLSIADSQIDTIGKETESILKKLNIPFKDYRKDNVKCIDRHISVCIKDFAKTDWRKRKYNLLHSWLLELGLYGKKSYQKLIPQAFICFLNKRQISLFLNRLFSTDGHYSVSKDRRYIEAGYSSVSEDLVDGIRLLLNKLQINGIKSYEKKIGKIGGRSNIVSRHNCFRLVISEALQLIRFIRHVNIFSKEDKVHNLEYLLKTRLKNYVMPSMTCKKIHQEIKKILSDRNNGRLYDTGLKKITSKYNLSNSKLKLTPRRAYKVAKELENTELFHTVDNEVEQIINDQNDFIQMKVIENKVIGSLEVYDLEVEENHSFISNFIHVHNSIAGSMIFTIFNEHALSALIRAMGTSGTYQERDSELATLLPDQIPPLDLTIAFANEYGALSDLRLYGLEFITDGAVFSIEDLLSESTMNCVCRDADIMTARGRISTSRTQRGMFDGKDNKDTTGSTLLFDNQSYYNYLSKLGVRRRLTNR